MNIIYTIGTSNRTIEDFGNILLHYKIRGLIDVRRFPVSRFVHFRREHLEPFVTGKGIDYRWMGDLLGGFRAGSYEEYLATDAFREGIAALEQGALARTTAICCAERLPLQCHRKFIARHLERRGWRVLHILDEAHLWRQLQGELDL